MEATLAYCCDINVVTKKTLVKALPALGESSAILLTSPLHPY